jgi:hypothetical protein
MFLRTLASTTGLVPMYRNEKPVATVGMISPFRTAFRLTQDLCLPTLLQAWQILCWHSSCRLGIHCLSLWGDSISVEEPV